ncbi:MAG: hypothetical protein ABI629_03885 [bacterium]
MPPGTFCVYRGPSTRFSGRLCEDDRLVIWTTHGEFADSAAAERDVYIGFVDAPDLLFHAVSDRRTHAQLTDYRVAPGAPPSPLSGSTSLQRSADGLSSHTFTLTLSAPVRLGGPAACAFDSYRGRFVGVVEFASDDGGEVVDRCQD